MRFDSLRARLVLLARGSPCLGFFGKAACAIQTSSAERRDGFSGTITEAPGLRERSRAGPLLFPACLLSWSIMYAFVRFLEDNVCYALPVSCVQDFSPKSRLDFDNQKVYTVYRSPAHEPEPEPDDDDDDEESPGEWAERPLLHKAQILALAGKTREGRVEASEARPFGSQAS